MHITPAAQPTTAPTWDLRVRRAAQHVVDTTSHFADLYVQAYAPRPAPRGVDAIPRQHAEAIRPIVEQACIQSEKHPQTQHPTRSLWVACLAATRQQNSQRVGASNVSCLTLALQRHEVQVAVRATCDDVLEAKLCKDNASGSITPTSDD